MTTTKIASGAGLRRLQIFALDSTGYPDGDQSGADGYDGTHLSGVQSIALNLPDIQPLQHLGDDIPFAYDYLPANTAITGTVNTGKTNLTVDGIITDTEVTTVGEAQMGGLSTDKQGSEIDLALLATRQAVDTDPDAGIAAGSRRWITYVIPKTRLVPKGSSPDQGAVDVNIYNMVPTPAQAAPWGLPFSDGTHGFTQSPVLRLISDNPLVMERWTGNATLATFNTNWTPITTAKTAVYVNGTPATVSSVDTDETPAFTLSTPPANAGKIMALYETSDDI